MASRDEILAKLKENLTLAQQRMKLLADKHRRAVSYELGDWVFLKLQPYCMKSLARKLNEKLNPRYYGPFQISEKLGSVAYRLALPPDCKLHPIFHVSKLKKALPPQAQLQELPTTLTDVGELIMTPQEVLAVRHRLDGAAEGLIWWKNLPACEDSWELLQELRRQFPYAHLEDKVGVQG